MEVEDVLKNSLPINRKNGQFFKERALKVRVSSKRWKNYRI